jgi:hypothetical protein
LSNQPTREARPRRPYTPPAVTQLNPTHNPSSSLPEKFRSNLKQLDAVLTLNPNDSIAAELQQALRRALAEQESRQPATA